MYKEHRLKLVYNNNQAKKGDLVVTENGSLIRVKGPVSSCISHILVALSDSEFIYPKKGVYYYTPEGIRKAGTGNIHSIDAQNIIASNDESLGFPLFTDEMIDFVINEVNVHKRLNPIKLGYNINEENGDEELYVSENGFVIAEYEYDKSGIKVVRTQKFTIEVEWLENGNYNMIRNNDGFSITELMGHISFIQLEIAKQMAGEIKPQVIKRNVILENDTK